MTKLKHNKRCVKCEHNYYLNCCFVAYVSMVLFSQIFLLQFYPLLICAYICLSINNNITPRCVFIFALYKDLWCCVCTMQFMELRCKYVLSEFMNVLKCNLLKCNNLVN